MARRCTTSKREGGFLGGKFFWFMTLESSSQTTWCQFSPFAPPPKNFCSNSKNSAAPPKIVHQLQKISDHLQKNAPPPSKIIAPPPTKYSTKEYYSTSESISPPPNKFCSSAYFSSTLHIYLLQSYKIMNCHILISQKYLRPTCNNSRCK